MVSAIIPGFFLVCILFSMIISTFTVSVLMGIASRPRISGIAALFGFSAVIPHLPGVPNVSGVSQFPSLSGISSITTISRFSVFPVVSRRALILLILSFFSCILFSIPFASSVFPPFMTPIMRLRSSFMIMPPLLSHWGAMSWGTLLSLRRGQRMRSIRRSRTS